MIDTDYHILFIFIDGLGLGPDFPEINPLASLTLPALEFLARKQRLVDTTQPVVETQHLFRPIDANLDMPGLPQSGTGQATLFTGINCAKLAGRHFGPFPHSRTREVLRTENLFQRIKEIPSGLDHPVAFANAYPPRFFTWATERNRWTVTTRMCLDSHVRIRDTEDLKSGMAISADLTGKHWESLQMDVQSITEDQSSDNLYNLSRGLILTLFEYFLTDKAGHSQSFQQATEALLSLDRFLHRIIGHIDPSRDLLLVTSDHGNIEDLSTRSHTRNSIPLIAYGRGAPHFQDVQDLTDVTPAVIAAVMSEVEGRIKA